MTRKKQKSFLIRLLKRVVGFKEACKIAKDLVSLHDFSGDESLMDIIKLLLDKYYNYRAAYYCPFIETCKELVYDEYTNKIVVAQNIHLGKMSLAVTTYLWENCWDATDIHTQVTVVKASLLLKEWWEDASYALSCKKHHAIRCYWKHNGWRKVHTSSYKDAFYPHDFCEDEYTVATGLKNPWY